MKTSTINSLLTAKAIYNESKPLVCSENKYSCSAGLILLQDCLELVILALLIKKNVDENKSIESKSFDELLGELKIIGVNIPKLGTIKALNKQRVIVKHYGQLAEPETIKTYAYASKIFLDSCLNQVIGKTLSDVLLTDFIPDCESKNYLLNAIRLKEQKKYLEGLIEIRKAFYVEYEHEYAIHKWKDYNPNDDVYGLHGFLLGARKAPYWCRNKKWIEENVKCLLDYIQIDHKRYDLTHWNGV